RARGSAAPPSRRNAGAALAVPGSHLLARARWHRSGCATARRVFLLVSHLSAKHRSVARPTPLSAELRSVLAARGAPADGHPPAGRRDRLPLPMARQAAWHKYQRSLPASHTGNSWRAFPPSDEYEGRAWILLSPFILLQGACSLQRIDRIYGYTQL